MQTRIIYSISEEKNGMKNMKSSVKNRDSILKKLNSKRIQIKS